MEKVIVINKFSTADAGNIKYTFNGSDLILTFDDWTEETHTIHFKDIEYFKMDDKVDLNKFTYDCPHEIKNSNLIKQKKLNPEFYKHYMFCFNAWSNLEIISSKI